MHGNLLRQLCGGLLIVVLAAAVFGEDVKPEKKTREERYLAAARRQELAAIERAKDNWEELDAELREGLKSRSLDRGERADLARRVRESKEFYQRRSKTAELEPPALLANLRIGDVGHLRRPVKIDQVINAREAKCTLVFPYQARIDVWITGVDTSKITDNSSVTFSEAFEVVGTKQFESWRRTYTVLHLKSFDPAAATKLLNAERDKARKNEKPTKPVKDAAGK